MKLDPAYLQAGDDDANDPKVKWRQEMVSTVGKSAKTIQKVPRVQK